MTPSYSGSISASPAKPTCIGELHLIQPGNDEAIAVRRIYVGHDTTVGRDQSKCQWVLADPYLSTKHLRIYSVVYENEDEHELEYLVYCEDLSRHGTYWNGSLIGRGNGGFLLSNGDKLRLSRQTTFCFVVPDASTQSNHFDLTQESEMAHFRGQYVLTDRLLGSGAFGKVFMAIEQNMRKQVACKLIDLRKLNHSTSRHFQRNETSAHPAPADRSSQVQQIKGWADDQRTGSMLEGKLKVFYREIDILSSLCHPNIVSVEKVFVTDNSIYIFQDLITAGDLFSYLESKNGKLREVEAAVIVRQILLALQFLHGQNIVHRDLKPENIMMTSLSAGCRVVLTDFGAARKVGSSARMASVVGSEQYAAPELSRLKTKGGSKTKGYTKAIDMWSVGAITIVLLSGGSAFSDPTTGSYSPLLARNADLNSLKKSQEWRQIRDRPQNFITKLLVLNETSRMTAHQALDHPWFSNEMHQTDFEELYQRTIKNWHPRTPKSQIVEFVRSTFIKHLAPSQLYVEHRPRSRSGGVPVEPPYRPFPRNMYIPIWPKRTSIGRQMSTEVRTAIADSWSGKPRKLQSRFKSYPDHEAARDKISTQSKQSHEVSSVSTDTLISKSGGHVAMLPLRLVLDLSSKLTTALPPPQTNTSSKKNFSELSTEAISTQGASNGTEKKEAPSSPDRMPVSFTRNRRVARGLSRISSNTSARFATRKRPRASVFDIADDVENESENSTSEGSCEDFGKKRKIDAEKEGIRNDWTNLVVPHSPRASLDESLAD